MKKYLTFAALALVSAFALAASPVAESCPGNSCHGGSATTGPIAVSTGAVTTTANAVALSEGGSVRNSGNSSAAGGAASAGVRDSGNSTASTANANNASQTVTVQGDAAQLRAPVNTAYAAGLTASNGTCLGSASGGAQGVAFGLSFGSTTKDEDCNLRYYAQALGALGHPDAAVAVLCTNPTVQAALTAVGKLCSKGAAKVSAAPTPAAGKVQVQYTDPFVRSRLGLPPL